MKNASEHAQKLAELLEQIMPVECPPEVSSDPVHVLIESMMLWEAPAEKAAVAMSKIDQDVVDHNDLRVTMEHELIEVIGARYPKISDRSKRLRAVLRDIYGREHCMQFNSIRETGKREIRRYIETLAGITPYAASRTLLLSYDTHTIPVDGRLLAALTTAGVAEPAMDESDLSSWLARHIKASDGSAAHFALQAWVDSNPKGDAKKSTAGASRKKTTPTDKPAAKSASG